MIDQDFEYINDGWQAELLENRMVAITGVLLV
jgi:hypothetical protein